jgi:autotransporter passenger strand-loop-strand repeat protein
MSNSAGAVASNTQVKSGGFEHVEAGGTASGTVISGGTVEIASGGSTGSTAITFALGAGGTLRLDDSVHFGGLVAGFGVPGGLDLADIAFISGTTSVGFVEAGNNLSGTLHVTDGTHTANITLLGQYVAGNFNIGSDLHGGTIVTDPPVQAQTDPNPLVNPQHHA